jgi:hypothetical protein
MEGTPQLEDLIELVEGRHPEGRPLDYLTESVLVSDQLDDLADELVGYFVDLAREAGASWAEIGASLGVSKQAAQKRFVTVKHKKRTGLFTRFATQARQVVIRAQEHARETGSRHVGTEHILLGLVDDEASVASRAIVACGVALAEVKQAVGAGGDLDVAPVSGHIPFSPDAKKLLELSLREALRLGHRRIGSEDILLGMLRDGASPGAKALTGLGVKRAAVEDWLATA